MPTLAVLLCLLVPQDPQPPAGPGIDATVRAEVVDRTLATVRAEYVFPDVAEAVAAHVRARVAAGAYHAIDRGEVLAATLTADLQQVAKDKHLHVRHHERPLPPRRAPEAAEPPVPDLRRLERFRREAARDNFAFRRVERLDGNVGLIELDAFLPSSIAGDRMTAAMQFVADCDALIFDLRRNGGGTPEMVAFACSYLFGDEPVHLNDIHYRAHVGQWWTMPGVPGRKFAGDVYVLTSSRTFSGAEEFAYDLQAQKRATIVGEVTSGGANPGGMHRLHDHFSMFVPFGSAKNPITKTNWEGLGVQPDVPVSAEQALAKAHALALRKLLATEAPDELQAERRDTLARLANAPGSAASVR